MKTRFFLEPTTNELTDHEILEHILHEQGRCGPCCEVCEVEIEELYRQLGGEG